MGKKKSIKKRRFKEIVENNFCGLFCSRKDVIFYYKESRKKYREFYGKINFHGIRLPIDIKIFQDKELETASMKDINSSMENMDKWIPIMLIILNLIGSEIKINETEEKEISNTESIIETRTPINKVELTELINEIKDKR
jgi:hypothetical protein